MAKAEFKIVLPILFTSLGLLTVPACGGEEGRVSIPVTRTPWPTFTPTTELIDPFLIKKEAVVATPTPSATSEPPPPELAALSTPPTAKATPELFTQELTPSPLPEGEVESKPLTETPVEPQEAVVSESDFTISKIRLLTNEENGGKSQNGSVVGCGYDHNIFVSVVDKEGRPLDRVVIGDLYGNPGHITGEKGPGRAEYNVYPGGGYELLVEKDSVGNPVTSQISRPMSTNDEKIPNADLIAGQYCASEEECNERKTQNSLCRGHYSWEIIFQKTR